MKMDTVPPLPDLPPVVHGELMTKTSVLLSVLPPEQGSAAAGDGGGDDDDDDDEVQSSDDEADEAAGEASGLACVVTCRECGRAFSSEAFLALHAGKKTCRPIKSNNTAEARAVRALEGMLENGSVVVHGRNADISRVAPPLPAAAAGGGAPDCHAAKFPVGWAKRPQHGRTKGHTYMTDAHKSKIRGYFNAGESDKGMKKSPALMLEALQADAKGHEKHYVPFVSEITPYISQLILAAKRGVEPSGDGSRGAKKAVVPEKYLAELEGIMNAYSPPSSSSKPEPKMKKTGPNCAHEQLKKKYPAPLPGDFPKLPAVQRFQDDWYAKKEGEQQEAAAAEYH